MRQYIWIEITPHMHYGVVPITKDGRLSAKEVVGNKKALTEFQDGSIRILISKAMI